MTSTYEIIKALNGKTTDWAGLNEALESRYHVDCGEFSKDQAARFSEKGVRAARNAAMEMACAIVHKAATKSSFIPASEETKAWGGCLGGETVVWTDQDASEAATHEIGELVKKFS